MRSAPRWAMSRLRSRRPGELVGRADGAVEGHARAGRLGQPVGQPVVDDDEGEPGELVGKGDEGADHGGPHFSVWARSCAACWSAAAASRSRRRLSAAACCSVEVGVGRDRLGVAQPGLGELVGPLLGGLAARGLLLLGLAGGGRVLAVAAAARRRTPRARPRRAPRPSARRPRGWSRAAPARPPRAWRRRRPRRRRRPCGCVASACWSCPSSTRSSLPLTAPATSLALPATLSNSPSRASAALSLLMTSGARFGTSDTLLRV